MPSISFVFVSDTPRPTITLELGKSAPTPQPDSADTRPWVLIDHAGHDNELVIDRFDTFREAIKGQRAHGSGDVLKRLADDTFTTEF